MPAEVVVQPRKTTRRIARVSFKLLDEMTFIVVQVVDTLLLIARLLIEILESQDGGKRLWRNADVIFEQEIEISFGIARFPLELANTDQPVAPRELAYSIVHDLVDPLDRSQLMQKELLDRGDLVVGIWQVFDLLPDLFAFVAETISEAEEIICHVVHRLAKELVGGGCCKLYANRAGLRFRSR